MDSSVNMTQLFVPDDGGADQLLPNVEPPVSDWCFDLILFYRSIGEEDQQAASVLEQLETWAAVNF